MHEPQKNCNGFKSSDDTLQLLNVQSQIMGRDETAAVLLLANINTAKISDEAMAANKERELGVKK